MLTENEKSTRGIKWLICLGFFLSVAVISNAQSGQDADALPADKLSLNDLSGFRAAGKNWRIVGDVSADMNKDQVLNAMPGKGILANLSDENNRSHLFTQLEHGDIEIDMEVLMAKGSNSGIYLQGRYEVQLFDSWAKKDRKYSYMGGIYQRTDTATNVGYEGSAPLLNACKAPGLWQKLTIIFRAPDFDEQGKKINDARFLKVYLNGVLVQDDVAVSGPTRSAAFMDERPLGPIMIQGNHGRVAFRNIRFRVYDDSKVEVKGLAYREYKTPGEFMKNLAALEKTNERNVDSISRHVALQPDIFLMEYRGKMQFPRTGSYLFKLQTGGGGILVINGDTVIRHDGANGFEQAVSRVFKARASSVPFTLIYNKPIQYREGLALFVEGPGVAMHPLHAPGSVFVEPRVEPIIIAPGKERAVIQRSFMNSSDGKKTHCLSVGTPQGIHFTMDLERGNLFQVWDGAFLDATPMWHRRGNGQVGIPLGARILFPDVAPFTTSGVGLKFTEYNLDVQGMPEFLYSDSNMKIRDKVIPSATQRSVTRKIRINGVGDFEYKLASGNVIDQLEDGSFLVNDKEYYLVVKAPGLQPRIERAGTSKTVVLHGTASGDLEFEYTLLW